MLSRDKLEKALGALDWAKVEAALAAAGGPAVDVERVAEIVLRTSALVFRYPNPAAEAKRQQLQEALRTYLGAANSQSVNDVFETLKLAEAGYRTVVRALAETDAGKLPVQEHITGALAICEREAQAIVEKVEQQQAERKYLTQHIALRDEDGKVFSPDAALEQLVNMVGITLQMYAFSEGWFDKNGHVVAPLLENVSDETVFKVGATGMLAILWRRWENTEERARFLGRWLREVPKEHWPADAPADLKLLVRHQPESDLELLHQVAFERLKDWLSQNFFEMMSDRSVEHLEVGSKPGCTSACPVSSCCPR